MLPACIDAVVIEIVLSTYVVGDDLVVVVVHRPALVFGIEILKQDVIEPWGIRKTDFKS